MADKKRPQDYGLIPASELGLNEDDFIIDPDVLNKELYLSYEAMCHSTDANDKTKAYEDVNDGIFVENFSVFGQRGMFQWYALCPYYHEKLHTISDEKQEYNEAYLNLRNSGGFMLGQTLANAINETAFFHYLPNPIVANTEIIAPRSLYEDYFWMSSFLGSFFENVKQNVFIEEDSKKKYNKAEIQGKDIIFPLPYATESTINYFVDIASCLIKFGAKTVTAISLGRLVPSITGEDTKISSNILFPLISPNPFFEISRM